MASVTGTFILRPFASEGVVASTVPADTPIEDVYKLVNEEVADDDATYFIPQSNPDVILENMLCLRFALPEGIKINLISELRYEARYKGMVSTYIFPARYSTKERLTSEGDDWGISSTNANTYADDYGYGTDRSPLTSDMWIVPDYEKMKSCFNNNDFCILMYGYGTKTAGNLTQIYLELDCEYEEAGTPIYFKENETWEELSGTIYKKTNGIWEEVAPENIPLLEYPIEEVS